MGWRRPNNRLDVRLAMLDGPRGEPGDIWTRELVFSGNCCLGFDDGEGDLNGRGRLGRFLVGVTSMREFVDPARIIKAEGQPPPNFSNDKLLLELWNQRYKCYD